MGPETWLLSHLLHRPPRAHRPCSALRSLGSRVLPGSPSLLPGPLLKCLLRSHTRGCPLAHLCIIALSTAPGGDSASLPVHAVHSLRKCVLTQSQYLSLRAEQKRHSMANPSYNELPRERRVHVIHLTFLPARPHEPHQPVLSRRQTLTPGHTLEVYTAPPSPRTWSTPH